MLELFELGDLADGLPYTLSAGDRQRVGLARALVNRPVLLIADEPTGNLDPDATEQIVALLKRVHDAGTTVFIATHDEEALSLLDCRTLMMCGGRVFEENDHRIASSL
jgi:cell division transport system ATP-binding protein